MSLFCVETFIIPFGLNNTQLLNQALLRGGYLPWAPSHSPATPADHGLSPPFPDDFSLKPSFILICRSRINHFFLFMSASLKNSLLLTSTFGCKFWNSSFKNLNHEQRFVHSRPHAAQCLGLRMTETRTSPLSSCLSSWGGNYRYRVLQLCVHTHLNPEEKAPSH